MQIWAVVVWAAAAVHLQLTSAVYSKVLSSASQTLSYLSTGEELYAVPSLQAYSVLFWVQFHSPLPSSTPILSLTSQGKEAVRVWMESGHIKGEGCSACFECASVSLAGATEAYKWVHVGVTVDCLAHNFTLTVTPWKMTTTQASGHADSPLILYDWKGSNLSVGGFAVSST